MKNSLVFVIILFIISSCQPSTFYQLYNVETSQKRIKKQESNFKYEDKYCIIYYNLWFKNGNPGYEFHNKTTKPIKINLDECYFIKNGYAEDYYKNRIFTKTKGRGISQSESVGASKQLTGFNLSNYLQTNKASTSNSSTGTYKTESSISYQEKLKIIVPPGTSKFISEFSINSSLIRNCDLLKYPKPKERSSANYNEKNSPIKFKNVISYTVGDKKITTNNKFYVSQITNYPSSSFYYYGKNEFCNEKSYQSIKYFNFIGFDKFYLKYSKIEEDYLKH